jgi:hypothetical protein
MTSKLETPKPKEVKVKDEEPKTITPTDGSNEAEQARIQTALETSKEFEAGQEKAREDQKKLEALTKTAQNNAGGPNSDAPSLEETHEQALESVARSHANQNAGFAGAIANQMASAPAHPQAAKTVADVHPRVRHISEFSDPKDPYLGHPDQVKSLS